MKTTRYNCFE